MAERQMHAMALLVHKLICDGEYLYLRTLLLCFNFGKSNSTLMCMILCNRIMTLPSLLLQNTLRFESELSTTAAAFRSSFAAF